MAAIKLDDISGLTEDFFAGKVDVDAEAAKYSRQEIAGFYRENIARLSGLVRAMTSRQLDYRMAGTPQGSDASGDEEHFNTSEIVTHLASGTAFHWWQITRALRHERPVFPPRPEGARLTGSGKSTMGAGGWSGVPAEELTALLDDTARRFLDYVEGLPDDTDMSARARYGVFGNLSTHGWLMLAGVHSAAHVQQVEQMRAQPDYPRE